MSAGTDVTAVLEQLTASDLRHLGAAKELAEAAEPVPELEPPDPATVIAWRRAMPTVGAYPPAPPAAELADMRWLRGDAARLEAVAYEAGRRSPAETAAAAAFALADELGLAEDLALRLIVTGIARAQKEARDG